ncbi:hypothetical protein LSCM1_04286 [Leishmania martiniquensis]|uniref:intramembrane prenyl-peptidase Rce1 n=1 Tax=Leishmania martiniquensis TaxID=1580590 RepID=A0A836KJJ4_9TRYP|nr:hypothetical protein LSCM1_04286 [Leishmania martiniquensis]
MDLLFCAGASLAFIGAFYVWPSERRFLYSGLKSLHAASRDLTVYVDRDSDEAIRRRTISFAMCTVASAVYLALNPVPPVATKQHGTWLRPVLRASLSTLLLFAGPLSESYWLGTFEAPESALLVWRNYVLCPIGEEMFYRGVLFSLMRCRSSVARIGVSALLFALSHTHHLVSMATDAYRARDGVDVENKDNSMKERACWRLARRAMCGTIVFTTLFGLMSGYYYEHVCEGSIAAIAAAHALCNVIGPPNFTVLRGGRFSASQKAASAATYIAGVAAWAWTLVLY